MGDHRRFSNDIKGVLSLHLTYLESIRSLINPNSMSGTAKEVLESLGPELMTPIKNTEPNVDPRSARTQDRTSRI